MAKNLVLREVVSDFMRVTVLCSLCKNTSLALIANIFMIGLVLDVCMLAVQFVQLSPAPVLLSPSTRSAMLVLPRVSVQASAN